MSQALVLTVDGGPLAGTEFTLESGAATLGRDASCAIRFGPGETQVSRRHALVEATAEGFRLTDQRSTNGTWVDGQRVQTVLLRPGDVVGLGSQGPRLRVGLAAPRPLPPPGRPTDPLRPSLVDRSLYDPVRDRGQSHRLLGVVAVLSMMGLGACLGLLLALVTVFELGPGMALVGVLVAFTPAPVYLALWLWLDRYDPEPAWVLAACLAWGGGAATFVASLVNSAFGAVVLHLTSNQGLSDLLGASLSAPVVEEAMKGVAVLALYVVLRQEFDGVLDGIVYAGVVALGFATVENVLYYGRVAGQEGLPGLVLVFGLRGVLSPFTHAVFTSMTGIGVGFARLSHSAGLKVAAPLFGYACAVFLHFLWNTLAAFSGNLLGFLVLYLVVWAPLFLVFFAGVVWAGLRESALIRRMLEPEVESGLISREQAEIVGSWSRRVGWTLAALGDLRRLSARREFIHAASRLALTAWHVERTAAAGGLTLSFGRVPRFRQQLERLRGTV